LKTGETTHYPTGLPHALSSAGFCFDETTGKILSSTFCQVDHTRKAFIFDTNTRKIVKCFQNLPVSGNQLAASIRLRDGSFLGAYVVPKLELVRWYPERDEIEIVSGALSLDEIEWSYTLTARADGAVYIPQHGWFNPQENCVVAGALAPSEATWFGTRGTKMYGLECTRGGNAILREWDTESGSVHAIYEIPDCGSSACCMTRDGQIACIGRYGHFIIIEPDSGALLRRETLESDSVGELDCIYRADNNTLIATPFITQRFLQIDMKSGRGYDMGRANNGIGEVLQIAGACGKIYMASYTEGQLSEYDVSLRMLYPENPATVAMPGHNALRPVAMCQSADSIFYACSHDYGYTGSVLVRFDIRSGKHVACDNALGARMIRSLAWDDGIGCIVAGTTYEADCRSCLPEVDTCVLACIDAVTLAATRTVTAPHGTYEASVLGRVDGGYLVSCLNEAAANPDLQLDTAPSTKLMLLNADDMTLSDIKPHKIICTPKNTFFTGVTGRYLIGDGDTLALWELYGCEWRKISDVCVLPEWYRVHIQDGAAYIAAGDKIHTFSL
ncbi:MAG: hypothetical protein RR994_03575, partial [Clostridia bacterium]